MPGRELEEGGELVAESALDVVQAVVVIRGDRFQGFSGGVDGDGGGGRGGAAPTRARDADCTRGGGGARSLNCATHETGSLQNVAPRERFDEGSSGDAESARALSVTLSAGPPVVAIAEGDRPPRGAFK